MKIWDKKIIKEIIVIFFWNHFKIRLIDDVFITLNLVFIILFDERLKTKDFLAIKEIIIEIRRDCY